VGFEVGFGFFGDKRSRENCQLFFELSKTTFWASELFFSSKTGKCNNFHREKRALGDFRGQIRTL